MKTLLSVEVGGPDTLVLTEVDDPTLGGLIEHWRESGALGAASQKLVAALCNFDEAAIWTIHSFCARMLQESAFESNAAFEAGFLAEAGMETTDHAVMHKAHSINLSSAWRIGAS